MIGKLGRRIWNNVAHETLHSRKGTTEMLARAESRLTKATDHVSALKAAHAPSAPLTEAEKIAAEGSDVIREIEKDAAETMAQTRADGQAKIAQARTDAEVARIQRQSQRDVEQMNKEFAKQDRNWFQRHKILTGLGALGAGGLAYNIAGPAGTGISNGGLSPEEAGSQKAMMNAMQSGYGPVMMGTPMPQVQAANLNYEGPMMDGAAMARG